MRNLWLAAAAIAGLACATPATAQRVWQNGRWVVMPKGTPHHVGAIKPHRWGKPVNGRWSAGWQAPGGWNSYRRLHRGHMLPSYWMGTGFRVPDYLSFGLAAPPQGYHWVRYYDDAVLVDSRGLVWDSRDAINWGDGATYGYAGGSYSNGYAEAGASYAAPRIEAYDDYDDIPVAPDVPPPPPGASYDAPIPAPYSAYPAAPLPPAPPVHVQSYPAAVPPVQVQTYTAPCAQVCGGAYQGGAFYGGSAYAGGYYAAGTTTVVITPAPIVTTTTVVEERIIEDRLVVTPKRTLRKKMLRRTPSCRC